MDQKDLDMLRDILEEAGVPQNKVSDFLSAYQPAVKEATPETNRADISRELELQIANTRDWRLRASLVAKKISWEMSDDT